MKKQSSKGLALSRQTLRVLSSDELHHAQGGNEVAPASWPCTAYQCPSLVQTYCNPCATDHLPTLK